MTSQGNEKEGKYPRHIERPANEKDNLKFCCLDIAKEEELDKYGGKIGGTEEISISSSKLQEKKEGELTIPAYDTTEKGKERNSGSVENRGEK